MQLDIEALTVEFGSLLEVYKIQKGSYSSTTGLWADGATITKIIINSTVQPLKGSELKFAPTGTTLENSIKFYTKDYYPISDEEEVVDYDTKVVYAGKTYRIFARNPWTSSGLTYYRYNAVQVRIDPVAPVE